MPLQQRNFLWMKEQMSESIQLHMENYIVNISKPFIWSTANSCRLLDDTSLSNIFPIRMIGIFLISICAIPLDKVTKIVWSYPSLLVFDRVYNFYPCCICRARNWTFSVRDDYPHTWNHYWPPHLPLYTSESKLLFILLAFSAILFIWFPF